MNPHIFGEKCYTAYVWFANAVASEGAVTDHAKRVKVARLLVSPDNPMDQFIKTDFVGQGYNWETAQATINDRLSALCTNLVLLGFGD